jgi:hypothetical protein
MHTLYCVNEALSTHGDTDTEGDQATNPIGLAREAMGLTREKPILTSWLYGCHVPGVRCQVLGMKGPIWDWVALALPVPREEPGRKVHRSHWQSPKGHARGRPHELRCAREYHRRVRSY